MKHAEWLELGALVGELWPGRAWPPNTMAAAYQHFERVPRDKTEKALREFFAEGREHPPAPGVVLTRALQLVVDSMPKLSDPDLTRPLTAEEKEAARLQLAALSSAQTEVIKATWMEFARHARNCKACARVAEACRTSGLSSTAGINPWLDDACIDGRPLFSAWREACFALSLAAMGRLQEEASL